MANYINKVMGFKSNIPPNVKQALDKIGNQTIISARVGRTPVQAAVQGALRALATVPYDNLFHLFLELQLSDRKWVIEKIERITLVPEDRSNKPGAEFTASFPVNKTVNELFTNTQNYMGDRFLPYQSNSNNCQVFIMGVLTANGLNTPQLTAFVKQDTRSIFKGNPILRKFANTLTDLGGYANAALQGGAIHRSNELSNFDIDHLMAHYRIPYHGCYVKNRLPRHLKNGAYIINLNGSSHWTALIKDGSHSYYFDAFGFPGPKEVDDRVGEYVWSDQDIQSMASSSCGWYCIAFIKHLWNKKDKENAYKSFLHLFKTKNLMNNEHILGGLLH